MSSHLLRFVTLALALPLACQADDTPEQTDTSGGPSDDGSSDSGAPVPGDVTPEAILARGGCSDASGPGTDHGASITSDETWTAADSPHRITTGITITATVTIEPCAVVLIADGAYVYIGDDPEPGKIVARGEIADDGSLRPVVFDAIDPQVGWGQLSVEPSGEIELSIAALLHGGNAPTNQPGALLLRGRAGGTNDGVPIANGTVDRVLIEGSFGHGLNLEAWGALTEASHDLWIRNGGIESAQEPVLVEPGVIGTLPDGLVLSGNLRDEIRVYTNKTFMVDDTIEDHGAPYRMATGVRVAPSTDGDPVTLTIEPGVTLAFETANGGITLGDTDTRQGLLVADGTADAPIVFTSALDPQVAGAWLGLVFSYYPLTGNSISNARIEYAGGESGYSSFGCGPGDNDAAVIIEGQGADEVPPDEVFIHDTVFDHIGGETVIVSGWYWDSGPDFSVGNTFGADTGACKVSQPRRTGAGDYCDGGRDICFGG